MTTSPIPCKRPKVTVEPHPSGVAGAWQGICHVPGCSAEPYNSVKTACEEYAVRHRAEHRNAVPLIQVDKLNSGGHRASCETAKAWAEHERVAAEAAARGQSDAPVARLKTGPKRREQTDVVERLDVARCPKCHTHHDAGHLCPNCGTDTAQVEGSKAS